MKAKNKTASRKAAKGRLAHLTDEQKGWVAIELLPPVEQKAFRRFCDKLGVGPQHLIRHCVGGFHPDGMKDSDFIIAVLEEAGKL